MNENRDRLDALAHALLDHETLDQDDAYAAAGIDAPPQTGHDRHAAPTASAARSARLTGSAP